MAQPIKLHPKIRERINARVSTSALAEYIITTPDRQDTVLHDARFMRSQPVNNYRDALTSIKAYSVDKKRERSILEAAVAALTAKSNATHFTPSQKEEALISLI